ncbi:SDR family oxidoreductase [Paenibacillus psychroresistens]|uniref:SDR family oxidoreductase n=1 Tax=Paenibacillus psychroresistens TaxID=1778678 RepID=A0A6B8RRW0_9BACL|nr:NAD-dependent epimerase/dehydratase family protein [Paenibacillus psychroresistens]QGQ98462.1 SDR family oxidoreductase [Paenibacillus psychroresistens]
MRKILVTGATGFVGANLVRALLAKPDLEIYILARRTSDLWRIADVKQQLKQLIYCNLEDRAEVFEIIDKAKPNVVYHVATYGGFPSQSNHSQMLQSNIQATMNLLDASISSGVATFINTGTSSEYGLKNHPIKETDLCEPVNFYGITKLAATNYCTMLGKTSETKVCTLRLFSPYGELEDPSRLYPSIVNSLLSNERPKLSRPQSVRDFIAIEKVAQVYLDIIDTDFSSGDIINVASGEQQTIEQFYNSIALKLDKTHLQPIWGEAPPRANEPQMWQADVSKLKSLLPQIK